MKICPVCKIPKSEKEFSKNAARHDGIQAQCKKCHGRILTTYMRNKARELRQRVPDKLGRKCVCGFSDERALQIDHVNNNGHLEKLSGIRFLQKVLRDDKRQFQILCANCNWIKRSEYEKSKETIMTDL